MARHRTPSHLMESNKKHYTKADIENRTNSEVPLNDDNVVPAKFLPKRLHKRFKEIVDEMREWGLVSNLDTDALSQYVLAMDKYGDLVKQMEKKEFVDPDYKNLSLLEKKYFEQTLKLANVLGLNMVSRMKLARQKQDESEQEKSDEDILFGDALKLVN